MTNSFTISTVNVNGIRAAVKTRNENNHGMLPWLSENTPDVVLMQEIRASEAITRKALAPALDDGWHLHMTESSVKGRSGVGILSRTEPTAVRTGFGSDEFDELGRYIEADFDLGGGPVTAASLYLPSGAALTDDPKDVEKYEEKVRFLDEFGPYLDGLRDDARQVVVAGDWNIAHTERDIKNWRGNRRTPDSCHTSANGWAPASTAVGSMWRAPTTVTSTVPTRGGPGAVRPSTTTPAGASTTTWRRRRSPTDSSGPGSIARRPTTVAGPTTRRSPPSSPERNPVAPI